MYSIYLSYDRFKADKTLIFTMSTKPEERNENFKIAKLTSITLLNEDTG